MRAIDRALDVASRQHGVITRAQLLDAGAPDSTIDDRLRSGRLVALQPGTYVVLGSPRTWKQRVMAATLAVGPRAAASHITAAALLGLTETPSGAIHVTAPHGAHDGRRLNFVVHRARTLERQDVRVVDGIPVTCPARTLVDLAGVLSEHRLASVIDTTLIRGLVSIDACRMYVETRRLTTRRGVGRLLRILDDRETGVPASELERGFLAIVDEYDLPEPARQVAVGPYRVDFVYPAFVVELDGRATHGTAEAFTGDRTRDNETVLSGRVPLRFSWEHVTKQRQYVADAIARALSLPRASLRVPTSTSP